MKKTFIDSCGKRRVGTDLLCIHCGKSFMTRIDQPAKFCSKKCFGLASRKRVQVFCAWCGRPFEVTKSRTLVGVTKSGLKFCSHQCHSDASKIESGIKEIYPAHYGTGINSPSYRRPFKNSEFVCKRCGYKEFSCGIDIHHIDEDRANNKRENLLPLCANCHRALHAEKWGLKDIDFRR